MPLWSDFSELVWIQTICPIVVWIWSEFSPFSLNFKNIDYMNGLLTVWSHWYITFTAMSPIPNLKIHLFLEAPYNDCLHYFGYVYKSNVVIDASGWRVSSGLNFWWKWSKSVWIWSEFQYFFGLNWVWILPISVWTQ